MNNTSHTPGPWRIEGSSILDSDESDVGVVANVIWPDAKIGGANASLIAAAPDLLAACREAMAIRNTSYQVDANPKIDLLERRKLKDQLWAIERRILNAIAKAEGRES